VKAVKAEFSDEKEKLISKLTLIRKAVKAECEGCEMRKRSLVRTVRVRRMC
jgi:hypothetical protein